ncbi:hypothetical protein [Microbacterium sp. NPDC089188]|uniref:hypothetical protein n=1 Tax=Microbacterium sp. NPDC089188 TaxID=3154971 RepID=UPI00342D4FFE
MELAVLIVSIGAFVATACATAIAWYQAIAAGGAEKIASKAAEAADGSRKAAERQATAADGSRVAAERQALAADGSRAAAERQATAAEQAADSTDYNWSVDRHTRGVEEIIELLYTEMDIAVDTTVWGRRALTRVRIDKHFVRARALLADADNGKEVCEWVRMQRAQVQGHIDAAMGEIASGKPGARVRAALHVVETTVEVVLAWHQGDLGPLSKVLA